MGRLDGLIPNWRIFDGLVLSEFDIFSMGWLDSEIRIWWFLMGRLDGLIRIWRIFDGLVRWWARQGCSTLIEEAQPALLQVSSFDFSFDQRINILHSEDGLKNRNNMKFVETC